MRFVRENVDGKLKGGALFSIYLPTILQTRGDFSDSHYISIWGGFLKTFKEFHRFIEELYAHLYHWYVRNIEFASILKRLSFKGLKLDKYTVFFLGQMLV